MSGLPRPELNAASVELLIGMLSTAAQPAGDAEWQWGWTDPPGPEALRERFDRIAPFFDLVAEGAPAFLHDLDPLAGASLRQTPRAQDALPAPPEPRGYLPALLVW